MHSVIIATLVLATAGCSGSRLRSLVTRSDYQSLEELEAKDALAVERSIADKEGTLAASDKSQLVSQSREVDADEPEDSKWFSISRLFSRESDDSELGTDPFVEPLPNKAAEPAKKPEATEVAASEKTESPVAAKQPQFSATINDVEKQAEELFTEMSSAEAVVEEPPFADPNVSAVAEVVVAAPKTAVAPAVESKSFEDFMAKRETAKVVDQASKSFFEETAEPVKVAQNKIASSFDSLLDEAAPAVDATKTSPPASFDETFFPELKEALAEAEAEAAFGSLINSQDRNSPFGRQRKSVADEAADPFAEASTKHGFEEVQHRDPWASFRGSNVTKAMSWSMEDSAKSVSNEQVVWGASESPRPTPDFDEAAAAEGSAPVFTQVSSSSSAANNQRAGYSQSYEPALVIPGVLLESMTFEQSPAPVEANELEPSSLESDPFFTSIPQAIPVSSEALAIDANGSMAASGSSGGWPIRTWFFILGCIIVAFLLFMPDRQNRAND